MEIRSSKLFKRQVADLVCYLKVTFGKRIAFRVKNEIEEKVFLLKLFPNMGTVESLLQEYCTTYRGGDWFDFLANICGVTLATLFSYFVLRPWIMKRKTGIH